MSEESPRSNPYVGLPPFREEDALYFYGREQQTAELLEILRQHRFLGVLGSSGTGKSSLVRAGLLPALRGGFLTDAHDAWCIVTMRPGAAPYENLCAELQQVLQGATAPEDADALANELRDRPLDAALDFLRPSLPKNAGLLLLVDQFEEIFAYRGRDRDEQDNAEKHDEQDEAKRHKARHDRARRRAEAAEFVDLLLALAKQSDLPIYVVLTMRTDFLGDCDLFYGLPEALNRGRYLVPRMSREQLRDAVECPARLLGANVSSRLTDHVLNELGDRFDRLPVLQHALLRTWEAWERGGRIGAVDLHHFENDAGGLKDALNRDADNALDALKDQESAVRRVFQRLTKVDHARRRLRNPTRMSKLVASTGVDRVTVERIVACFQGEGRSFLFSTADGQPDDPRVDIAHESLIRQWKKLSEWVDQERVARDEYQELVAKSRKHEKGGTLLLQGPELQLALAWRSRVDPDAGWAERYSDGESDFSRTSAYVDASLAAHRAREAEPVWRADWRRWATGAMLGQVLFGLYLLNVEMVEGSPVIADVIARLRGNGELATSWSELSDWLLESVGLLLNYNVHFLVACGVACTLLNLGLKRLYGRLAMRRILARMAAEGDRYQARAECFPEAGQSGSPSFAKTQNRVAGFFIDAVRQAVVYSLALVVVGGADNLLQEHHYLNVAHLEESMLLAVYLVPLLVNWWMAVTPLVSERQATWGMRRAGVYRTDLYGQRLTLARATAWYLARYVSFALYLIGFAPQPFMPRRQTLHDWLAGTVVLSGTPEPHTPQA
jgi:uncharacterized RDD family membrane protein YckC